MPRFQNYATIYTDGGCRNHGNKAGQHVKPTDPAAWATEIKFTNPDMPTISLTNGKFGQTNNYMELTAVQEALVYLAHNHLEGQNLLLVLDSKYIYNAITNHWLEKWHSANFMVNSHKQRPNASLWSSIYYLLQQFDFLDLEWTKGHANNVGNNFVDHLLNLTMDDMKAHPNNYQK